LLDAPGSLDRRALHARRGASVRAPWSQRSGGL